MKEKIELFKFELPKDFLDGKEVFTVNFPKEWVILLEKYNKLNTFKLDFFGKSVSTVQDGVIHYNVSQEALNGNIPWLYLEKDTDMEALKVLGALWIKNKIEEVKKDMPVLKITEEDSAILNSIVIEQSKDSLNKSEIEKMPRVVSFLAAKEMTKNKIPFKNTAIVKREKKSDGKRVAIEGITEFDLDFDISYNENWYDVISKPIALKKGYFSIVLSFSYVLEPFTEKKYLHINISSRRWMFEENIEISFSYNHSLYVKRKNDKRMIKFNIAKKNGKVIFKYNDLEIYENYIRGNEDYSLDNVLSNPKKFIEDKEFFIGIPFSYAHFTNTKNDNYPINYGVDFVFKDFLMKYLSEEKIYGDNVSKDLIPTRKKKGELFEITTDAVTNQKEGEIKGKRRTSLKSHSMLGKTDSIIIEIYEDGEDKLISKEIKDILEKYYCDFEFTDSGIFFETFNGKCVFIDFVNKEKNNIDREMEFKKDSDGKTDNIEKINTENTRKKEILELLDRDKRSKDSLYYALFEILNMKDKEGDTKKIIRESFAKRGIKTQFIFPKNESVADFDQRVRGSLKDIFNKIGLVHKLENVDRNLYAFNFLRNGDSHLPVLIRMNEYDLSFNFISENEWYNIQEVQKILALKKNTNSFVPWDKVQRKMKDLISSKRENILILPASLRNNKKENVIVDELHNEKIDKDLFLLKTIKNLSIVRTNSLSDVPSYVIYNPKGETSVISGIVKINDNVYYSAASKQDSVQINKKDSRFAYNWDGYYSQRILLELVILSNNQNNDEIAKIVHKTRKLLPGTNYDLADNYLLYLMNSIKEYL